LFPDHDAQKRALLTKALFSSVHGIVLLGLDEASAGVPAAQLDEIFSFIFRHLAT
jgi:hypothetical protein